jgi:hypothetical protein
LSRVAALDIGKAEVVCCVRVPYEGKPGWRLQEVEAYSTMTPSLLACRAGGVVVEVGAQVDKAGLGIGQQVPDDDQDGASDGDDGPLLAAAPRDAPVCSPRKVLVLPADTAADFRIDLDGPRVIDDLPPPALDASQGTTLLQQQPR